MSQALDDLPRVVLGFGHPAAPGGLVLGPHVVMGGTLAARPAAGLPGRLYLATDNGGGALYRDSGTGWVQAAGAVNSPVILDRDMAEAEVVNTIAETTVYSFSVPGGTLGTTGMLMLKFAGNWLANSGAPILIVRAKFGGTVVGVSNFAGAALANDVDRAAFTGEVLICANGATNSQRTHLTVWTGGRLTAEVANPPTTGAAGTTHVTENNALALDTTAAQTLAVTAQWSVANAANSYRLESAVLVKL
jgi:hypothetical protein